MRKDHRKFVMIRGVDNHSVACGAAWLRDVFHTALCSPLNIVGKGEERIAG